MSCEFEDNDMQLFGGEDECEEDECEEDVSHSYIRPKLNKIEVNKE